MTQIEFHFNAPDKLAYVCRLLRKASSMEKGLWVIAPDEVLQPLDAALWALSSTDFVTHCHASDDTLMRHSSVILSAACPSEGVLKTGIHLGEVCPNGFDRFARWIEVVSTDPSDRAQARERWKQYAAQGYELQRKDLHLKAP
jgi:DNA polymerase-3 subunit chi